MRVVEFRAVDIQRARNVAVGLRSRGLLFTEEKCGRSRVDKRSSARAFDSLNITRRSQDTLVDSRCENLRRRRLWSALERQPRLTPGSNATVEDRDVLHADILQRPIGAR